MVNLVLVISFLSMYDNQGVDSVGLVSETVLVYMYHSVEYNVSYVLKVWSTMSHFHRKLNTTNVLKITIVLSYIQMNFDTCPTSDTTYPCSIFEDRHPSTVAMTVLVVVEMFNALNNLSENQSLLVIPPWSNLWLVGSFVLTMRLHILILYVQPLSILFSVTPLSWADWVVVVYHSFPVIIDEILKFFSRNSYAPRLNLKFIRRDLLPKRESRENEAHHN